MKKVSRIYCGMPIELEKFGDFGIYRRDCDYGVNYYQVRAKDGSLLKNFDTLEEAREDALERFAVILLEEEREKYSKVGMSVPDHLLTEES